MGNLYIFLRNLSKETKLRYEVVHERIILKRILNTQNSVDSTELAWDMNQKKNFVKMIRNFGVHKRGVFID